MGMLARRRAKKEEEGIKNLHSDIIFLRSRIGSGEEQHRAGAEAMRGKLRERAENGRLNQAAINDNIEAYGKRLDEVEADIKTGPKERPTYWLREKEQERRELIILTSFLAELREKNRKAQG